MSKFKIINLIDKIFVTVAVFLIIYAWINFFIRDLYTTFILSLIFTFACIFLLFHFINKKNKTAKTTKNLANEIDSCFLAFKLLPLKEKLNFLKPILAGKINDNNTLTYYNNQVKTLILVATHIEKINQNDIVNLLSENINSNATTIEIICNDYDQNIKLNILKNIHIKLITKSTLYKEFFLKNNTFPDTSNIDLKSIKLSFKDIAKNFFLPHKAKSYFLCGLILIFSSIILPYHIYYLVFGSVLLIFSVLCKIIPKIKH